MIPHLHKTVELLGLNHLAKTQDFFVDRGLACSTRRSSGFCIFSLPWLWGSRHFPSFDVTVLLTLV
ncbi:hypothetical protein HanPSC8_Chr10g0408531 [Helianthus annuus]|nr:hypothetical protein HanPSC8_Chr10g0408531 [Helianthus annuus]